MVNINLSDALERAITSADFYYTNETDAWDEHFYLEYASNILLEACEFMNRKNPGSKEICQSLLKHFGIR